MLCLFNPSPLSHFIIASFIVFNIFLFVAFVFYTTFAQLS